MPAIALKVEGIRDKTLSTEEAEQVLSRWQTVTAPDDVVVKKVDLSCRQWTPDAIKVLRPVLEKAAPTVMILDIQDSIAGLMTDVGFEVMELFTDIFKDAKELVEVNNNDNATGPRVLERIAPLLGNPHVKRLYFHNCGLSAETMPMLDEALMVGGKGPGLARLQALTLNKNMIGVEGARFVGERLATMPNLTGFSYNGCRPETAGSKHLAQGLKNLVEQNPDTVIALADLQLADCSFMGDDKDFGMVEDLGKALEKMPKLTRLNLRDAGDLEEKGAGILAQALMTSKCKLVDLDLSGCCLGEDGAETLAEMLRQNLDTLKELKLELNEFGNDGVEKILAAFSLDNCLERLHLDENELDDSAIDLLLEANLPKLRILSLKDNDGLEEAEDEKKEELRKKFPNVTILISDEDEEAAADVKEDPDADVEALADELAKLGK